MFKRKLSIFIFFVLLFPFVPQVIHTADLNEGFSGIKWGTDISVLKGFTKMGDNDKVSYYLNPNEMHSIKDIDVPRVIYGFYNGKFFVVLAVIDKFEVYSQLKSRLTAKFGNPQMTLTARQEQTIYRWKHNDIKIKLKLRGIDDKMKLAFYYIPLSAKIDENRVEEATERSLRFFPVEKGKKWDRIPLLEF
jgi:hypothetical protein